MQRYARARGIPGHAQAFVDNAVVGRYGAPDVYGEPPYRENAIGREGGLLPDDPDDFGNFPDPFALVFDFFAIDTTAIPPQGRRQVNVTLTPEAAVVVANYVFTETVDAGATTSVTIRDTASSREQMTDFVQSVNIAGTAQNPFWLIVPRTYAQKTTVTVTLRNNSAAGSGLDVDAYEFVMHGFKVLDPRKLRRTMQICLGMGRR